MFDADKYILSLIEKLKDAYGERLIYVGLQGSYLRNEATEHSDIDIMVVVKEITTTDLDVYRKAICVLPDYEKSCGFICGLEELQNWNPLEICHLVHTTKDYYGNLLALVPDYTEKDINSYVKMCLGNLYHELCHRYIHSPIENSIEKLPYTYKSVFFILQNLHYLKSGKFITTKKELLEELGVKDKIILKTAISLSEESGYNFDESFSLIFSWCKETMVNL